jgi:hypothetical protein
VGGSGLAACSGLAQPSPRQQLLPRKRSMGDEDAGIADDECDRNTVRNCSGRGGSSPRAQQREETQSQPQQQQQQEQQEQGLDGVQACNSVLPASESMGDLLDLLNELTSVDCNLQL